MVKELKEQADNRGHLFKKGISGNPLGRPRGVGKIGELRQQIADALPEIVDRLVSSAKNGDVQSARLLIDKVIPNVRPQSLPINFEVAEESFYVNSAAILSAAMRGELPLEEASDFISAVNNYSKLTEFHELEGRLLRLEKISMEGCHEKVSEKD